MKFLMTLNMPAFEGRLVHQLTVEIPKIKSLEELLENMNRYEFIMGRHMYRQKNMYTQESEWENRGDVIINTAHIGKVVEFVEMDGNYYDDGQRGPSVIRTASQGPRRPIRP